MVRPRQRHVGKTQADKRLYWETIIRARPGPTLEDTPIIDTTDHTTAVAEEAETPLSHPTKAPSAIGNFLREKRGELLIVVIIIGLLGWSARELYLLNREVGELTSNVNNIREGQSQLNSEIEKVEQRLVRRVEGISSEMDRLEQRIDGLLDRGSQGRENQ